MRNEVIYEKVHFFILFKITSCNQMIAGLSQPSRRLIDPNAPDSKGMAMARRFTPRSSPFAPCLLRQPTAVSSGNGFKANSPLKQVKKRDIRTVVHGFVQQAGTSANDQSLSRQRARNVA